MKRPISLAQELRAIRYGNNAEGSGQNPDLGESAPPWQTDIDRVQQTLQDVLQSISHLSGIELPGGGADECEGDSMPRLDCRTLKDRIRNNLKAFSVTSTAEIAKRAEEQTRAALGTVRDEASGQIEQVVKEFREKLQGQLQPAEIQVDVTQQSRDRVVELVQAQTDEFARWVWLTCKGTGTPIPEQIEKLLEPYAEKGLAMFTVSFRQKVQDLLEEQEQVIQARVEGMTSTLENQVRALGQASRQVCERHVDEVSKQSAERLNSVMHKAARNFQNRSGSEIEAALGQFQARLEGMNATLQERLQGQEDLQAERFSRKLEGLAGEVQEQCSAEIAGRIEQTAVVVIESSVQHLHQQADDALEHSKGDVKGFLQLQMEKVRGQVSELAWSTHETLSRDAARLADNLKGMYQELTEIENKHIAASEQQISGLIQTTVESLTGRIRQIAETQIEQINRSVQESQEKAASCYDLQLRQATEGHYRNLLERIQKEAGEVGTRVVDEVQAVSESVMQELSDKVNASTSVLREEAIQATSHIELSIKNSLETYRKQVAQITDTGLERQRNAITGSVTELHNRLKQAAELLAGDDSKAV